MILHIPHASKNIPAELRDQFLLTDVELAAVCSVMIEVNRRLYLNEATGEKTAGFDRLRYELGLLLEAINHFRVQNSHK